MRVDDNPFVVITAQDTPIDIGAPKIEVPAIKLPNATEQQQKAYEESFQATTAAIQSIAAIGSPYRVAVGEKAEMLIEQIKTGKQLKFRILGVNKAITSTARIEITDQFKSALRECKML